LGETGYGGSFTPRCRTLKQEAIFAKLKSNPHFRFANREWGFLYLQIAKNVPLYAGLFLYHRALQLGSKNKEGLRFKFP
jgi:hypothetical protein